MALAIRDVDGLDRRLALMVLTGEETGKLDFCPQQLPGKDLSAAAEACFFPACV